MAVSLSSSSVSTITNISVNRYTIPTISTIQNKDFIRTLTLNPHEEWARLLQACSQSRNLLLGKQVHAHLIKSESNLGTYIWNNLLNMYAKCGDLDDACQVFENLSERDLVSWNCIIAACVKNRHYEDALYFYGHMQELGVKPNQYTLGSVLKACATVGNLDQGVEIHNYIAQSGTKLDVFVGSALIDLYAKCGSVGDAKIVFEGMMERNAVTWNTMITMYDQNGHSEEALELLSTMRRAGLKPDRFTFASILRCCATLALPNHSKIFHADVIKNGFLSDVFVGSALVDAYAKSQNMEDACQVFGTLSNRNIVSWNAIIAGYNQIGQGWEALRFFCQMKKAGVKLDHFSFASLLSACAAMGALKIGEVIHCEIVKTGSELHVFVGSALVDMYAKCKSMASAQRLFDKLPTRNLVTWNAMIIGHAHNGHGVDALKLFSEMLQIKVEQDHFTFTSVLKACTTLTTLEGGKQIHAFIIKAGLEACVVVGTALVDMYATCGSLADSYEVFDRMPERNAISWTAMIGGYAQHGHSKEALELFEQMQEEGIQPSKVTFICILSACSNMGLVDEGRIHFDSMAQLYGIMPEMEHYACMVAMLGRSGQLDAALNFIADMPFTPGTSVWQSMLGACRIHGNLQLGEQIAKRILEMNPEHSSTYVLLSNMYAANGRWNDVEKVRNMMRNRGVVKVPGCSWIEVIFVCVHCISRCVGGVKIGHSVSVWVCGYEGRRDCSAEKSIKMNAGEE
ncbi:hypothetical protein SUGI_0922690 [Cryptomeria japonica]|nr:hypothetical protein SUGI_0922690 [Cryptomeria japonica]